MVFFVVHLNLENDTPSPELNMVHLKMAPWKKEMGGSPNYFLQVTGFPHQPIHQSPGQRCSWSLCAPTAGELVHVRPQPPCSRWKSCDMKKPVTGMYSGISC